MIKPCFLILFFLFTGLISGQNINNENLAREYYRQGEFKKASILFGDIYKKKKVKSIYSKYLDCLIQIQSYKQAEKIIKTFYKKNNDPTILIDLGKVYVLKSEEELAKEKFDLAIKEAKQSKRLLPSVAAKFFKEKNYEYALEAYTLAKKESNKASYSIQIANIYSYLGDIDSMYQELINLLRTNPNYFQTCKNKFRITINDDDQNENNKKLKKILLKNIQKNDSAEISKMLIWLFMQEKKFEDALHYEISLDKRLFNNTEDIVKLGEVALSNNNYTTAIDAFSYILKKGEKYSYYYEYSSIKILDVKFAILREQKIKKSDEIKRLETEYNKTIKELGIKSETIFTLTNYCDILATYLNKEQEAIDLLQNTINNTSLNTYDIAICKMKLAEILVGVGDVWESILLYSQVEKEFKDDVIGQQAKFEKTKINYYEGDFEWAQNQLKVLKLSTSKLIANNAMKLSLLISDNLNLDTTDSALILYAQAELLFEQKKYNTALQILEKLNQSFPNHSLLDEMLLKKSEIFIETKEYPKALDCLNTICEKYYYDILYDDALFYQAQIYENVLNDNMSAKEKYEEILLKTPNSIFTNKARKRYRALRKNNFLIPQ